MKWPFARHTHAPESLPPQRLEADAPIRGSSLQTQDGDGGSGAPARREWATLPPLKVAGGRPINLASAAKAFTDGLASRQVLVRTARLEHVRPMDAPTGSFRGVLAPSADEPGSAAPELQEGSPLPAIEHRQVAAVAGERRDPQTMSPVERLLAIGEPDAGRGSPLAELDAIRTSPPSPPEITDEPGEGDSSRGPARRAGLADSRRLGLGPAYHGPLPEAMRAERERSDHPITTESVSSDMRATMRDVLGVDVGDRLVHRGPAVSAEARSMNAQAFTRDGEVHISDEVGPLDTPTGRATLAHELTHAAQQIVRGTLPDEGSDSGRALETHAQQVEQYVRGDGGAPKPSPDLLHVRPPVAETTTDADAELAASTRQMMRELVDSGLARADGKGGIIFTMPPSSMTASTGTQRLTTSAPAAQPGAAARHENWSGAAQFGNQLAQGLGSDLLGVAGSMFGFSDEFMGEQRHSLANANREFERNQTKQAYTELRMEHLRTAALQQFNDESQLLGHGRVESLDEGTMTAIHDRVETEVNTRMQLLRDQTAIALRQLNEGRAGRHEAALTEIPDESYDAAFHRVFDDPNTDEVPPEADLLRMLAQTPSAGAHPSSPGSAGGTGGAPRPGGGPGGVGTGGAGGAHTAGATTGSPTAHTGTGAGAGHGTGAAHRDEPWRTSDTMGGRFAGLGNALVGDVANAELGFFGSVLGFDQHFEQSLHDQVHPGRASAAGGTGGAHGATDTAHAGAAGAAHADAAHAATGHGAAQASPAAHETVDHIVGDPYALDELANRLYPNIRSRLRTELLIDRERAGLLADFR